MLAKIYALIWSRIGGRPWTDIVRDEQKAEPLFFLLIFLGLGILLIKLGRRYWWQLLIAYLFGILTGHFWW
jgi:hypothetical protein